MRPRRKSCGYSAALWASLLAGASEEAAEDAGTASFSEEALSALDSVLDSDSALEALADSVFDSLAELLWLSLEAVLVLPE